MIGWIGLAALIMTSQSEPPPEDKVIVVTARSLPQTERALTECLARGCPPKEDIDASLAHGENLFLSGDYAGARHILSRSRDRNMRHAKDFPVDVADLARALGRVSNFTGHVDSAQLAQIESLDALKSGLDPSDARVLTQRMMIADELIRQNRLVGGEEIYRKIEKQAIAAKLPRVLGAVMLRRAVVYSALASVDSRYRQEAKQRIARLERTTDPALADFRDAVGVLRVRIAALEGKADALDAAVAALGPRRYARPTLVYSPPIEIDQRSRGNSKTVVNIGDDRPQWIDMTFEIGADGRTDRIEILRRSDTVRGNWPDRVRAALAERRYAPISENVPPQLLHRIERFSLVYNLTTNTGSRIRTRTSQGRIVSLDLTQDGPLTGD